MEIQILTHRYKNMELRTWFSDNGKGMVPCCNQTAADLKRGALIPSPSIGFCSAFFLHCSSSPDFWLYSLFLSLLCRTTDRRWFAKQTIATPNHTDKELKAPPPEQHEKTNLVGGINKSLVLLDFPDCDFTFLYQELSSIISCFALVNHAVQL